MLCETEGFTRVKAGKWPDIKSLYLRWRAGGLVGRAKTPDLRAGLSKLANYLIPPQLSMHDETGGTVCLCVCA